MGQCLDILARVRNNGTHVSELHERTSNVVITSTPNRTFIVPTNSNDSTLSERYVTALPFSPNASSSLEQTITQDMFKSPFDNKTEGEDRE